MDLASGPGPRRRHWHIEISPASAGGTTQRKELPMTDKKVWLITGAGRGLGLDIAKAALAAGHAVVATGRDSAKGHGGDRPPQRLFGDRARRPSSGGRTRRGGGRRYQVWPNRRPGQQCRQLLRRLLRGTQSRPGSQSDRDTVVWPDERDPGCPASDAEAALGPAPHSLLDRRHHRPNVLHSVCCSEVWHRRVD